MASLPWTDKALKRPKLLSTASFIDGQEYAAKSGKTFGLVDPCTGKEFAQVTDCSAEDVDVAVGSCFKTFAGYRKVSPHVRSTRLMAFHRLVDENKDDLALLLTAETGKPLKESYLEVDYGNSFNYWFAGEAERVHGTAMRAAVSGRRIFTVKQPVGCVAALLPWNFPIAMILRKLSAALAAGCCVVAKPSPETPLTILALARLAIQAGFEPGCFNVITTSNQNTPAVAERLCRHDQIAKITLTGSTPVGKLIARHCADGLKKITLELGGNAPFILFQDADLEQALTALMTLKYRHAGQACITANRIYVHSKVYDQFASMLIERIKRDLVVGHGIDDKSTLGPLTVPRSVEKAQAHVDDAVKLGAKVLLGGKRPTHLEDGYFFEPTVLTNMNSDMLVHREETFAPVSALFRFETEEEVVAMANDTSMGLATYFFTKDSDRMFRLMENLEAGMIGCNTGNSSAAEAPFGGIKSSGYGKEAGLDVAINEYLITKTATVTVQDHY